MTELYKVFYEAAIKAIAATGDAYKNLSWFAHNKANSETEQKTKEAA